MNILSPTPEPAVLPPKYRNWTEADDALIHELRAAKYSWPMVNAVFGADARRRYYRIKMTPEERAARRASDVNVTWTAEQVESLKKCYADGLSYALMAPIVGLSKSACISKAKRLKLPPRIVTQTLPCPQRQKGSARKTSPKMRITRANFNSNQLRLFESVQTDLGTLRCVEVPSLDLTINQLNEATCRFIEGDPCAEGGALYCGNTIFKRSYCEAHFALTYVAPLPPKVYAMRRVA